MSKNYDNWERLVVAVLRRESDRQFAYIQSSCDSSSINSVSSLDLSFNSTARFDEDVDDVGIIGMSNNYNVILEKLARVVLQRESPLLERIARVVLNREREMPIAQTSQLLEKIKYSDLQSLRHSDWEKMLLPHQPQLVWTSASLIYYNDTSAPNRKGCFLVGSKNIEDLNYKHREFKSNTKSRFSEVLEIYDPEINLNIRCRIKTRMLSPNMKYAAYLLFAFTEEYVEEEVPWVARSILKTLPYDSAYSNKVKNKIVHFNTGYRRIDGWMEVKLGGFRIYPGEDREVHVRLMSITNITRPGGLVIEGIEFRPSKNNKRLNYNDDEHPIYPPTQKDQLLPIRTGNIFIAITMMSYFVASTRSIWPLLLKFPCGYISPVS